MAAVGRPMKAPNRGSLGKKFKPEFGRVNIAGVEAALSDLRRIYEEMDRGR